MVIVYMILDVNCINALETSLRWMDMDYRIIRNAIYKIVAIILEIVIATQTKMVILVPPSLIQAVALTKHHNN